MVYLLRYQTAAGVPAELVYFPGHEVECVADAMCMVADGVPVQIVPMQVFPEKRVS